jgi:hypothetical protein
VSDFEMISAYADAFNGMITLITIYFSIIFAFVVAGFLAAAQLNRTLAAVAVALFTIAAGLFILFIFVVQRNVMALAGVIRDAVVAGESSLGWLGFTVSNQAAVIRPVVLILLYSLLGLSYAGALFFFFQRRHIARRAAS